MRFWLLQLILLREKITRRAGARAAMEKLTRGAVATADAYVMFVNVRVELKVDLNVA